MNRLDYAERVQSPDAQTRTRIQVSKLQCKLSYANDGNRADLGTISSLYGLNHHYITQAQYTALVTVVILTAIVPTAVAQILFRPTQEPEEMEAEVP